ncbi:hypothetical protein [Aureispira anguillae]|uniref:Uncharacterized protein n=1 Tax=Aureispira anguillae TaxID=2864201 RepID=A0A915YD07_9BACT|nr:hypothetical protein [Aureispira anguillae]BDS10835.1 hypothetical protein AsAng_0015450 [Aureispira anguillae]
MNTETDNNSSAESDAQAANFHEHVKNTLSVSAYKNLPKALGYGRRKTTMLLLDPSKMELETMEKMAEFLGGNLRTMIDRYQMGYDVLSIRAYKKLMS